MVAHRLRYFYAFADVSSNDIWKGLSLHDARKISIRAVNIIKLTPIHKSPNYFDLVYWHVRSMER